MAGIGLAPRRSMTAEDIRDLQRRARHPRRALGRRLGFIELAGDVLQWAHDIADRPGGESPGPRSRRAPPPIAAGE